MPRKIRMAGCHINLKHFAKGFCKRCYDSNYSSVLNREKTNARKRAWRAANPDKALAISRKYLYGVDDITVRAILRAQDGLCKICAEKPATHLDHDHKTGRVRTMLCGACNQGLGLFRDDLKILETAIRYLKLFYDDRAIQIIANTGLRADGQP